MTQDIARDTCRSMSADLPVIVDDATREWAFKWAVYNNYPYYMFWVSNHSIGRIMDPSANISDLFNQSYNSGELELPTAQEFADFQAMQRRLRNLGGEAALVNEIGPTECSYFRMGYTNHIMTHHCIPMKVVAKISQIIYQIQL